MSISFTTRSVLHSADDFAASGFFFSFSLLSESLVVVCGNDDIVALPLSLTPDSPSSLCEESSLTLLLSSSQCQKGTGSTFGLPPQIDFIISKFQLIS